MSVPDVREGDVWADQDPRGGPVFLVTRVCDPHSDCHGPANDHVHVINTDGRRLRVIKRNSRFGAARGYKLIERRDEALR